MSRAKGSDKAAVEERKAGEALLFNLVFALDELAVTRLRIEQALRRDPSLADLLKPGLDELERVRGWLREVSGPLTLPSPEGRG